MQIRSLMVVLLLLSGLMLPPLSTARATGATTSGADETPPIAGRDTRGERPAVTEESLELLTDRRTIQQLQILNREIQVGRAERIRDELWHIQQQLPGLMVPQGADSLNAGVVWEPLWRRLFREVHQLKPQQLDELRRLDDGPSGADWDAASGLMSPDELIAVIHRFPASDAASQAHLIMASRHLDRGNLMAGLTWLLPVTQSASPSKWRSIARSVQSRVNDLLTESESESAKAAAAAAPEAPAAASAAQPATPSESASDAISDQSVPTNERWAHSPLFPPAVRDAIGRLATGAAVSRVIPWTNWQPAIDQNQLYTRTLRGVTAIRLEDGRPAWTWMSSRRLDAALMSSGRGFMDTPAPPGAEERNAFATLDRSPISNLLNRNSVIGRVTCDGTRLYLVEDHSVADSFQPSSPFVMRGTARTATPISELVALDVQTGRRLWSVGGPLMEEIFGNDLTKSWIAGPPTVNGTRLFCVVEQAETISLACLHSATGQLAWRSPLAFPAAPLAQDLTRRMTAAVPVVRQGIVWTSSTSGWMMGVDELTRNIIWACRTRRLPTTDDPRAMRGRVMTMTTVPSLGQSWRSEAPLLAGRNLVVFPESTGELLVLNALTGRQAARLTTDSFHVLCVYSDRSCIVTAGPRSFECFHVADGVSRWRTTLPSTSAVPTGSAESRNGRLIVPMSDGSFLQLSLETGAILEVTKDVRMPPMWGNLYRLPASELPAEKLPAEKLPAESLIVYSPQTVAMLSHDAVKTGGHTLEQAERLIRRGSAEKALTLLDQVDSGTTETDQIRVLRFYCLALLLAQGIQDNASAADLPAGPVELFRSLQALAKSPAENAVVIRFEVELLGITGPPNARSRKVCERVVDILSRGGAVLQEDVAVADENDPENPVSRLPDAVALTPARDVSNRAMAQLPLRTWLLGQLDQSAAETVRNENSQLPEWFDAALQKLDAETLAGLREPLLADLMLQRAQYRIQAGDFREATFHLLLQANGLAEQRRQDQGLLEQQPSPILAQFLDAASRPSDLTVDNSDRGWQRARNQLLSAIDSDFALRNSVRTSPAPAPVLTTDTPQLSTQSLSPKSHQGLAQRWMLYPDGRYSAVPVYQSMIMRNPDFAASAQHPDDPFLSAYDWQFQRSPSVLRATAGDADFSDSWFVPGNFSELASSGGSASSLGRHGSLLIARSNHAIAGISILERRVLWVRRMAPHAGQLISLSFGRSLFRDVTVGDHGNVEDRALAAMVKSGSFRIVGSSERQVCVQSAFRIEMLDLLTGETLWSRVADSALQHSVATTSVVLTLNFYPDRVVAYDAANGHAIPTRITADVLRHTLESVGDSLIVLRPHMTGQPRLLEWIDVHSGEVVRQLKLIEESLFQQVDSRTLIAFHSKGLRIIRLIDGTTRDYALDMNALLAKPDGTTATDRSASPPAGGSADPTADESELQAAGSLSRLAAWTDPVNYYVAASSEDGMGAAMARIGGRESVVYNGRIAAIDRATGEVRWIVDAKAASQISFDQPTSPILLLLSTDSQPRQPLIPGGGAFGQQGSPSTIVRGIHKITGTELFTHRLQSRFFVTFVRLAPGPGEGRSIDVEAYGSRIRFVPEKP